MVGDRSLLWGGLEYGLRTYQPSQISLAYIYGSPHQYRIAVKARPAALFLSADGCREYTTHLRQLREIILFPNPAIDVRLCPRTVIRPRTTGRLRMPGRSKLRCPGSFRSGDVVQAACAGLIEEDR